MNISHPDKVFWPEDGYTKGDLAEFYVTIFSKLEPYVKDRLLTLERCPDGMAGQCFYQKEMPKGMPASTPTKRIKTEESKRPFTNYVVGGTLETQLALVNLGCIAIHAMGGRAASPRQPDWFCFDLDPDSGEFSDAARAALYVKEGLDTLKLESFAKTREAAASTCSCRFASVRMSTPCALSPRIRRETGRRSSQGTHHGAFDRRAERTSLSRSIPKWIRANRGDAVFRAPQAQSSRIDAARMDRGKTLVDSVRV